MKALKLIRLVILLPSILVLIIYFMIRWIKEEHFSDNIIDHHLNKVYNGNDYWLEEIKKQLKCTLENYKVHMYVTSVLFWMIKLYNNYG